MAQPCVNATPALDQDVAPAMQMCPHLTQLASVAAARAQMSVAHVANAAAAQARDAANTYMQDPAQLQAAISAMRSTKPAPSVWEKVKAGAAALKNQAGAEVEAGVKAGVQAVEANPELLEEGAELAVEAASFARDLRDANDAMTWGADLSTHGPRTDFIDDDEDEVSVDEDHAEYEMVDDFRASGAGGENVLDEGIEEEAMHLRDATRELDSAVDDAGVALSIARDIEGDIEGDVEADIRRGGAGVYSSGELIECVPQLGHGTLLAAHDDSPGKLLLSCSLDKVHVASALDELGVVHVDFDGKHGVAADAITGAPVHLDGAGYNAPVAFLKCAARGASMHLYTLHSWLTHCAVSTADPVDGRSMHHPDNSVHRHMLHKHGLLHTADDDNRDTCAAGLASMLAMTSSLATPQHTGMHGSYLDTLHLVDAEHKHGRIAQRNAMTAALGRVLLQCAQ